MDLVQAFLDHRELSGFKGRDRDPAQRLGHSPSPVCRTCGPGAQRRSKRSLRRLEPPLFGEDPSEQFPYQMLELLPEDFGVGLAPSVEDGRDAIRIRLEFPLMAEWAEYVGTQGVTSDA